MLNANWRENELKWFKHKHQWVTTIAIVWKAKNEYYPFEKEDHGIPIEHLCVKCGLVQYRSYHNYLCGEKARMWRDGLLETYAWRDSWEIYNSTKENKHIETRNYAEIMNGMK